MLQLSPFVLPQVRMGALRLTTLNMSEQPERVAYAHGLQDHLEKLLGVCRDGVIDRAAVEQFHERAFLGTMLASIDWDAPSGPLLRRWEHAADLVSFDEEHLGVMFLDGRLRAEREMVYVPTGSATPGFVALIAAMARGTSIEELGGLAARHEVDIDADFIGYLGERGVLVEIDDPAARVPERFAPGPGDRVTWLGHNGLLFQSGPTTVWFDPLLPPRIRYRDDELAAAFSQDLANALFVPPPYGPDCEQLTVGDLPRPDAIVISHEDVAMFDLGVLMCVPESTPIVVPAQRDRPGQVDVAETIAKVIGERRVIRLAHGESIEVGAVRITATPYIGEWPTALPTDWNCYVVRGAEGALVVTQMASVLAEHAEHIAAHLGDRGRRAILFGCDVYAGDQMNHGFREAPWVHQAVHRPWPWYLRLDQLFEPNPVPGIQDEVLHALGAATGLARFFPYSSGGAPWLTFQVPHVHRYYIYNLRRGVFERQAAIARRSGFEIPPLQIGVPYAL